MRNHEVAFNLFLHMGRANVDNLLFMITLIMRREQDLQVTYIYINLLGDLHHISLHVKKHNIKKTKILVMLLLFFYWI